MTSTSPNAGLLKRIKKAEREVKRWPKWLRQALCCHNKLRPVGGIMNCWECVHCGAFIYDH